MKTNLPTIKVHSFLLRFITPILALSLFLALKSNANEQLRPTNPSQLPIGTVVDMGYRVETAKVVLFNRMALERDFKFLKGKTNEEIEKWILDNFAYVNSNQLKLTGIRNTEIRIDPKKTKKLYIPPGVGRGADIAIDGKPGLVSIKANGNSSWNKEQVEELVTLARSSSDGMAAARAKDHSNGLETYYLGAAEYLRQLEIQQDYNRRNAEGKSNFQTVESYFLIDLGFNLIYPDREIRAFEYGRQAHFGRTANNSPLSEEIYKDKGEFQESYTGSRIDFGGSRTVSEQEIPYHEAMKHLNPDEVSNFIKVQEKRILHNQELNQKELMNTFLTVGQIREVLTSNIRAYEKGPRAAAIGKSRLDIDQNWKIDVPLLAKIKWMLFQLDEKTLFRYLDELGDNAINNLLGLAKNKFQMPLPEAVYNYSLERPELREMAVVASSKVLDRFPKLVKPCVDHALTELRAVGNSWEPAEIHNLIHVEKEFPGYEEFLIKVLEMKTKGAKIDVIEKIWSQREKVDRVSRILKWISLFEADNEVLDRVIFRFPELKRTFSCKSFYGF